MKKEHYKLYKAGKLWLTAMIVAFGVAAGSAVANADQVNADAQVTAPAPATNKGSQASSASQPASNAGSKASSSTSSAASNASSASSSTSSAASSASSATHSDASSAASSADLTNAISSANAASSAAKAAADSVANYNKSFSDAAKSASDAAHNVQSTAASASAAASAASSAESLTDSLAKQWTGDTFIQSTATTVGSQMSAVATNSSAAANAGKSAASLASQIAKDVQAVSAAVSAVNSYATASSDAAAKAAAVKDLKSAQDLASQASTAASQATSAAASAATVYANAQKDIASANTQLAQLSKTASDANAAITSANTTIQSEAKAAADKYGINTNPGSGDHTKPTEIDPAQTPTAVTSKMSADMTLNDNGQIVWKNASGKQNSGWLVNDGSWYFFNNGAAYTGWMMYRGSWYYLSPSDGRSQTGLKTINGNTYYFDANSSAARTGWVALNDSKNNNKNQYWYYFDNTNAWALKGWQRINGHWYYFDANGANLKGVQTINNRTYAFDPANAWALGGWQKLNGSWYYFDTTNAWALALTGWQQINGNWYYFGNDGTAATGFTKLGNQTFHFDATNAWMDHGWLYLGGQWYYLNPNHDGSFGALKTGWQYINGSWYYLDPNNNGIMLKGSQWLSWGNTTSTYIFRDSGQMLSNGFQKDDAGNTYYLTASGAAASGFQTINGHSYYFDPQKRNAMATGNVPISGNNYYFNPSNGQQQRGLVITAAGDVLNYTGQGGTLSTADLKLNDGTTLKVNAQGKVDLTGLKDGAYQFSNGQTLSIKDHKVTTGWNGLKYFDPTTGSELYGWQQISPQGMLDGEGSWYYFGKDGNAVTGWFQSPLSGAWYYMDSKGAAATGWKQLPWSGGTSWFYFDETNANMYVNRWASLRWNNGNGSSTIGDYYFNGNGVMVTGWQNINGASYYFNGDGTLSNYSTRLINWFRSREGKISYNYNGGSRNGSDGTADCSGALTQALRDSGCSNYSHLYYTNELPDYLVANGYQLVAQGTGNLNVQHGDVVLWSGLNMCMVISTFGADPNCIAVSNYTNSAKTHSGTAVHEMSYSQYWNYAGHPYQYVYRPAKAEWR